MLTANTLKTKMNMFSVSAYGNSDCERETLRDLGADRAAHAQLAEALRRLREVRAVLGVLGAGPVEREAREHVPVDLGADPSQTLHKKYSNTLKHSTKNTLILYNTPQKYSWP